MITPDDCDAALQFLTETCEDIANAKAELERSAILAKRARKRVFLTDSGTSVAAREAAAEVHADVEAADDRHVEAITEYERLRAQRELHAIKVDVYRTQQASQRVAAR